MYRQLLASKRTFDEKAEAQNLLFLSTDQQNVIPTLIPAQNNNFNNSSNVSNFPEMHSDFRSRQRRGDTSDDFEPYSHNDNHNSQGNDDPLLAAPIGQIDDYDVDGDMERASRSPSSKRAKLHDQATPFSQTSTNTACTNISSMPQQASLMTPPSLPNSAFAFFFRIQRENLLEKAKNGGTKFENTQQVVQEIEKEWGLLAMEERRVYEHLAANDEKRYQREMEEYRQTQYQQQIQELTNQGRQLPGNSLQNVLLAGILPDHVPTAISVFHLDPRLQQINAIAQLRSPLPIAAATANTATNYAPSYHHFMPPSQQPTVVMNGSNNAIFSDRKTITPPHNAAGVSAAGGQLSSPTNSSVVSAPPPTLRTTNGTIVLPPSQSIVLPAGMEIELSGRMYKVGYEYQFMTREEAQQYVKPYTAAQSSGPVDTQQQQQKQEQDLSSSSS